MPLWSTPDLPHGEIQYLLIAIGLALGFEGTLIKKNSQQKSHGHRRCQRIP